MRSVYVASQKGGPVKIGVANDPKRRVGGLRTASPLPIELVFCAAVDGDAVAVEASAHMALRTVRLSGEWFSCDITEAISAVREAAISVGAHLVDRPSLMHGEPWQVRLRALGISQLELAEAIGMTPTNLSTGLRGKWKHGVPQDLKALILALERLSESKRAEWLTAAKAERRERAKP